MSANSNTIDYGSGHVPVSTAASFGDSFGIGMLIAVFGFLVILATQSIKKFRR